MQDRQSPRHEAGQGLVLLDPESCVEQVKSWQ